MDMLEPREVAKQIIADQNGFGGEVNDGYRLIPTQGDRVDVFEGIGSHEGRVVSHRQMPFVFWMESVAVACGQAPDPVDLEALHYAVSTELKEASRG